jgi:hypothetical protein
LLDSKMRKRQYWILDNQQWKIIYEGAAWAHFLKFT